MSQVTSKFVKLSSIITSIWTGTMNVCHTYVEQPGPTTDGDDIQCNWPIISRIQVDVHMLASVVATNGRYD